MKMILISINVFIIRKKISRFTSSMIKSTSMKSEIKNVKIKKSNTTKKSKTTTKSFSEVESTTNYSKFEKMFFEKERINRESTYIDFLFLSIFCSNFRSRLIISADLREETKNFVSRMSQKFVMIVDKK